MGRREKSRKKCRKIEEKGKNRIREKSGRGRTFK